MLRSGARPVAVVPTPEGLDLVWETLTEDLVAVQAGKLSVNIIDDPPGLRWVCSLPCPTRGYAINPLK